MKNNHSFQVLFWELDACVLYLSPLYWSCVFVTHWADFHPPLPLSVSLVEELIHDPVSPLPVQIQRFGGVAQICTMNHVTENLQEKKYHRLVCFFFFSSLCGK